MIRTGFAASSTVQDHVQCIASLRVSCRHINSPYKPRPHDRQHCGEGLDSSTPHQLHQPGPKRTKATLRPRNRTNNPSPKAQVSTKSQTQPLHTRHREQGSKPVSPRRSSPHKLNHGSQIADPPRWAEIPTTRRRPRGAIQEPNNSARGKNFHPEFSSLELLHGSRSGRLSHRETSPGGRRVVRQVDLRVETRRVDHGTDHSDRALARGTSHPPMSCMLRVRNVSVSPSEVLRGSRDRSWARCGD